MYIDPKWRVLTVGDGDLSFSASLLKNYQPQQLTATIYDSKGSLDEKYGDIVVNVLDESFGSEKNDGDDLKIIKVPGNFWHGTKTISSIPSETIYFLTNLYDYENPDEERMDWNNSTIINPKTKNPYDWNVDE
mgnify:CR=1 FL=1